MTTSIGVVMTEHIVAGRLTGSLGQQKLEGGRLRFPVDPSESEALIGLPAGEVYELLASQIAPLIAESSEPVARDWRRRTGHRAQRRRGRLTEPATDQGNTTGRRTRRSASAQGIKTPVYVLNDADAVAAGLAASGGHLDRLIRVWDAGQRHRLRTLAPDRRRVGRRSYDRHAGPQGALLRLRRAGPSRRNHGQSRHAAALP